MSFSRNNNLIEDVANDLDPSNDVVNVIHPEQTKPVKIEAPRNIGFNTFRFTAYGSTPIRLMGEDPARLRALITSDTNADIQIGDYAAVQNSANYSGFALPVHQNGGIELQTTNEVWAVYNNATTTASVVVYVYIERQVNE